MPPEDDLSSLEATRERLYTPRAVTDAIRSRIVHSEIGQVPHAWGMKVAPKAHPHVRLALVFFIGAVIFFVVAGGLGIFLLFSGSTSVSTDNISLQVQGPTTIAAGDTVPLSLAITNRNPVALQDATLEVDFPPGTRSASDETQDDPRYTEDLGSITPGESISRSIQAVVFGTAGQALSLPVSLSYQTVGSNAVFVKKLNYPLTVTSAPLSLSVSAPSQAVPGQPFTISIEARSNSTVPLSNVIVSSQLPFGFKLASSSMPMNSGAFSLGTLAPGASQVITLAGTLSDTAASSVAFNFTIGTGNAPTDTVPALAYMTQEANVDIAAPFLATSISINGNTASSPVLSPGATETGNVSWQNTLTEPVEDAIITLQINGAVAPGSIQTSNGFYDSSSNTITFSRDTDPTLENLAPGASGIGSFSFTTLSGASSPTVTLTVSISGVRASESNVPETIDASQVVNARVATSIAFSASSLHSSGPLTNSGPVPPVLGTPTTYTILWQLVDPGNDVTGISVSATLPSYVTWTGETSPSDGSVSYDAPTQTVTWHPSDLSSGQSTSAAFQVSLMPSATQSGQSPPLTGTANASAFDRYAQTSVTASAPPPTTATADLGSSNGGDVQ